MKELTTNRLTQIAEAVNAAHAEVEQHLQAGLQRAVEVGRLLAEAKSLVQHGEWGKWITDNCEFSERTAQNYMRISERYPELAKAQRVADCSTCRIDGAETDEMGNRASWNAASKITVNEQV